LVPFSVRRRKLEPIEGTNIDYREWPPSAPLAGAILAYWRVAGDGRSVPSPTILPDAYVEIVLNLAGVRRSVGIRVAE